MLRIILTFIVIYLIFRIVLFFIIPKLGQWYLNRHRDKFYRSNPAAAKAKERRDQQQMHIKQNKDHRITDTENLGEYIDFEEIKDDEE